MLIAMLSESATTTKVPTVDFKFNGTSLTSQTYVAERLLITDYKCPFQLWSLIDKRPTAKDMNKTKINVYTVTKLS